MERKRVKISATVTATAWIKEYPNGEIELDELDEVTEVDEFEVVSELD